MSFPWAKHNKCFHIGDCTKPEIVIAVAEECNVTMASQLTPGVSCPGYFLEIQAIDSFAFQHGGETIPVGPGLDNRTHLNLVTSLPAEP